jgi:spore germination protein KB
MIKEGKFGTFEAVCLTTLVLSTKDFYTSIRVLIKTTSTAAWYATLLSCTSSIIMFLFIYLLMKRFPGKNLIEVFEAVTGKVIGKILSVIFCAYFIYYCGSNLREFLEMIKAYNLPYTPPSQILFAFLLAVIVLSYIGIDGIARLSLLAFFPIVIGLATILISAYPIYNFNYLFPLGGYGVGQTIHQGLLRSSAYDEAIILAIIINSVHGLKNFRKAGVISLILSGVIISISVLCDIMAFAYTQGSENLSDLFQLSRLIYFNRFFQRVESIFLFIWVIASIITVSAAFYIAISVYCKAFKISNHKPLLLPCAFLTFMVTLLPENLSETVERNILFIRGYSVFVVYLIPILVLIASLVFGKKGEKEKVEKA